ncbi:hypothetical protein QJS10_CPA07g00420 [Acorus calamus]|uniref:DUF7081 domain-containing protein n=1 Tax=Acorus calamus TaxID=4465 RepID=A0AAV9EEQ4_ACOCL|nr:hypothetical protein QJS10_CPA07g00420 [Acorus calamus]
MELDGRDSSLTMKAWCLDESEYQTPAIREENSTSSATPVGPNASGEGLPYTPENFPNPGDKWVWMVGKRKTRSGYWADRYLSLPASLQKTSAFPSKVMVQKYITENFPTADIDSFFASFSWRILAPDSYEISGVVLCCLRFLHFMLCFPADYYDYHSGISKKG